jgi:hypothetical protein
MNKCPTNDWSCPYNKDGECKLKNPQEECDDFMYYNNNYEE